MFSQKLNRPIALVAAANVVGGGAYGIVNATAGKQLRHRDDSLTLRADACACLTVLVSISEAA